ncbi:MAG: rod shape-determining protein MreD [Eubacterium sp.]|nr:rod shape-determining protein MreD [Eubacterium sp.]
MRRRIIISALAILVLSLLQMSVIPSVPVSFLRPNLLLILVVSIGFMRGKRSGIWMGFAAGLVLDLFYGPALGFQALLFMLIGFANGFLCKVFFDEDLKVPVILVSVSELFYGICYYLFYFLANGQFAFLKYLRIAILPEVISSVIFTLVLYKLVFWANQRLSAYELEEQQSPWLRK